MKYEYPWGAKWDRSKANTFESGLQRSTAVGIYPGVLRNAVRWTYFRGGLPREWRLNEKYTPKNIESSGSLDWALRGGSWDDPWGRARASYRDGFEPRYRNECYGF